MGFLHRLLPLALLISTITADYVTFEKVPVPEEWVPSSSAVEPSKKLSMRIHLTQQNTKSFEKRFLDLSNPDHVDYGNFLTRDEVQAHLAPSESSVAAVKAWLAENGITEDVEAKYDSITFPATVEEAEKLLHAKYQTFDNPRTGKSVVRTLEYGVPEELAKNIALIQPTTMFGLNAMGKIVHNPRLFEAVTTFSSKEAVSASAIDIACNASITPDCLANLYGFKGYTPAGKGKIGVSGFLEQAAQYDDLTEFMQRYKPEGAAANFSVVSINGGENPQDADSNNIVEANLDIQYAIGIAYPIDTTYYTVGGRPPYKPDLDIVENDSEPYLDYLNWLLAQKELPDVISTSYGENEQTVPLSYRLTVCDKFKELGARGVSVLFSSGDSGPGWSCRTNDGKNSTRFLPIFPAACPWVTAVGGTVYVEPEEAVDFSAGGFSDTWLQPSYQASAVTSYFLKHPEAWTKWLKYFNPLGRGFPDVAAQGENYRVIVNGNQYLVDGTSASAPAFAAIIALVNDYRLQNGKKPLGFLNPLLYKNPKAFTDITKGTSVGCDGTIWGTPIEGNPAVIPNAGWEAVSGWDPVTGLGTPKFEELKKLP